MKYYAVKKGRNPGIYKSWEACQKEVSGYPGAIFKSFKNEKDALAFMEDREKEGQELSPDSAIAYVDGSYNIKEKIYGAGVVFIEEDGQSEYYKTYTDDYYVHRNVAGEVRASELAIDIAIEKGKKALTIYHDYQGIASWANKEWKANNELTKSYASRVEEKRKIIKISFVKVKGHSNDKYNDLADSLAKKAAGVE
ncbi:MAG: ribonuclease H family protein [Peptoniphilaceae bacterium]|nr:ribonuclease H family protein [Peptoniphilaceae bacterium]